MSLRPLATRSSWQATVGRGGRARRWLPAFALVAVVLVGSLMLGRALWPGAATARERLGDWRYGFRNTFTGYEVGGAPWADTDGTWHQGTAPTCLAPATSGQRVELGLVRVRAGADGRPGGVVVVWLRCL